MANGASVRISADQLSNLLSTVQKINTGNMPIRMAGTMAVGLGDKTSGIAMSSKVVQGAEAGMKTLGDAAVECLSQGQRSITGYKVYRSMSIYDFPNVVLSLKTEYWRHVFCKAVKRAFGSNSLNVETVCDNILNLLEESYAKVEKAYSDMDFAYFKVGGVNVSGYDGFKNQYNKGAGYNDLLNYAQNEGLVAINSDGSISTTSAPNSQNTVDLLSTMTN